MLRNKVSSDFRDSFVETFQAKKACPLCEETRRKTRVALEIRTIPLTFSECSGCGLVYQDPIPSADALKAYFDSREFISDGANTEDLTKTMGYYNYDAWDVSYRMTAALRLSLIGRWVKPGARLLEIGTSTGSFLNEARTAGYDVSGLDVSAQFAETARARYGVNIDNGFIEDYPLTPAGYDVICAFGGIACWSDPLRALTNIRQALRPGAPFILNFSDGANPLALMSGSAYPEYNHASLIVYSHKTMKRLLRQSGFEVLYDHTEWQYADMERIITYWKSNLLWKIVRALGLSKWMLKVPAIGTRFVICRPV